MEQVDQARAKRDAARKQLIEAQDELIEAIVSAAAMGCSLREIADRAGVSFQRISAVIRKSGGGLPPEPPAV